MEIKNIITLALEKNLWIATAESCTGGLISAELTSVSGSSGCFGYGVATYSNEAKIKLLNVSETTLAKYGAVSPETAEEMACGLLSLSNADIALSITGIAGPCGGSPEKPVGLVYCGIADIKGVDVVQFMFSGSREEVRKKTVLNALELLYAKIQSY